MEYNWISSKICIGRVFDKYNVDYSGFVPRVQHWIVNALNELGSLFTYADTEVVITITDYKGELPLNLLRINGVSYEGYRLNRLDVINYTDNTDMDTIYHPVEGYEIVANNHIVTTFEDGELTLYYRKLSVEFDDDLQMNFPLIPQNEELLIGLDNYILAALLRRGHKIREFSLASSNPYLNPALYWDSKQQHIRNSLYIIDSDERKMMSNLMRTLLVDFNAPESVSFNPNKKA